MANSETQQHTIDIEETSQQAAKKEEALGMSLQSNLISTIRKYEVERKYKENEKKKKEKKDVYFLFLHK